MRIFNENIQSAQPFFISKQNIISIQETNHNLVLDTNFCDLFLLLFLDNRAPPPPFNTWWSYLHIRSSLWGPLSEAPAEYIFIVYIQDDVRTFEAHAGSFGGHGRT